MNLSGLNPATWNLKVFYASGRNVLSGVAGLITLAAGMGLYGLSQQDGAGLIKNINTIWDAIITIANALVAIGGILTIVLNARKAGQSATPAAQVASAGEAAKADPEIKKQLLDKVAELPDVKGIVASPAMATATDSDKVVASPADVKV